MLLTGQYRRTLDEKLRLAIPKSLRKQVLDGQLLYLTPGLDGCVAVYPESSFAALSERLSAGSPAAPGARDYSRLFFARAQCVEPDRQGRFRIPALLAEKAQLDSEVIVLGVQDHLELWSADLWEDYVAGKEQHYDELAEAAFASSPPQHSPVIAEAAQEAVHRPK